MAQKGMRRVNGEGSTMRNFIDCRLTTVTVIKSRRLIWAEHVAKWKKVGVLSKFNI